MIISCTHFFLKKGSIQFFFKLSYWKQLANKPFNVVQPYFFLFLYSSKQGQHHNEIHLALAAIGTEMIGENKLTLNLSRKTMYTQTNHKRVQN